MESVVGSQYVTHLHDLTLFVKILLGCKFVVKIGPLALKKQVTLTLF